jgi:hypothetical protein
MPAPPTAPDSGSPASLRALAGGLGMVAGVAGFGYGLLAMFGGSPLPMAVALVLAGFVELVVSFFAVRRSRVAWSFALSLNGTAALVFLLGAPRVRDGFEVGWPLALGPAVLLIVVTAGFALSAADYEG